MASFFSHPAFPVALKIGSSRPVSKKLFILCLLLTCLPDADVLAFRFGIAYSSQWGHRGFTHSILFAVICGVLCTFFSRKIEASRKQVFWWTFLSTLSHSLMDALTNGGLGVALFWPLTSERFFFFWRPVEVSPIGVRGFLSLRGLIVVLNEVLWLWIPSLLAGFIWKLRMKKVPE